MNLERREQERQDYTFNLLSKWFRKAIFIFLTGTLVFFTYSNFSVYYGTPEFQPTQIVLTYLSSILTYLFFVFIDKFKFSAIVKYRVMYVFLLMQASYAALFAFNLSSFSLAFLFMFPLLGILSIDLPTYNLASATIAIVLVKALHFTVLDTPLTTLERTFVWIVFIIVVATGHLLRQAFAEITTTMVNFMNENEKQTENLEANYRAITNSSERIVGNISDLNNEIENSREYSQAIAENIRTISNGAINQADETHTGEFLLNELSKKIEEVNSKLETMTVEINNREKENKHSRQILETLKENSVKTKDLNENIKQEILDSNNEFANILGTLDSINKVSEQTNLLALNASIEAARAGEAGRGFSIVATEIQKLSEETKTSAEIISNAVTKFQTRMLSTNKLIDTIKTHAETSDEIIVNTISNFDKIIKTIVQLQTNISNINESNQVVVDKKTEILDKMNEIANIAATFSASTQEVDASISLQVDGIDKIYTLSSEILKSSNDLSEKMN